MNKTTEKESGVDMTPQQEYNKVYFRIGNRVKLRLVNEGDVDEMTKWVNDPEVTQYITINHPIYRESEIEYVKALQGRKDDFIFAVETIDGVYIGNMGLHKVNHIDGTASTGAMFGNKDYWGKGYGSEAKMLLLDFAFNNLNLRKIYSSAIAFNERSIAYQQKTGYQIEGVRKDQIFKNGKYWDEVLLAIFREDWISIWNQYKETGKISNTSS
jgi:RimJ/RimL family protein N-acetyltransferase